jgi:hypothetical protein
MPIRMHHMIISLEWKYDIAMRTTDTGSAEINDVMKEPLTQRALG